jgi:DNA repair protein RecN (Recombination protein N)
MLVELTIENLGVIEQASLLLRPGLTALTGETGAGKTMVVEAISLLMGARADGFLVRTGAAEARIDGRFVAGDEEVVLSRVIPVDGRSRAYVNGRLAAVASLAELGARLVDLHGQHSHQSLLSTAAQRRALDHAGDVDLAPLRAARGRLTEVEAALAALGGDARARAREVDLLRFQVREIEDAAVEGPDEDDRLRALEDVLADAAAHRVAGAAALAALTDDGGTLDTLGSAVAALGNRAPYSAVIERLRAATAELADVATELRTVAEGIDEDPERLAWVRERRHLLHELRRKYGETLADVLAFGQEASARLDELESFEARAAALEGERAAALEEVAAAERAVGAARRRAAPALASAVEEHLRRLAMPHARLEVTVGPDPGDDVTFLLAANPGTAPLPLSRVASGGELARAMLALRLVLTEAPDTLVFDEVDAGIGGAAADAVGRSLAELGTKHQVLLVTHLAQVAALAEHHLVVRKEQRPGPGGDGTTTTTVTAVTGDERVDEVARMLSGRPDSPAARQHAAELVEAGDGIRRSRS